MKYSFTFKIANVDSKCIFFKIHKQNIYGQFWRSMTWHYEINKILILTCPNELFFLLWSLKLISRSHEPMKVQVCIYIASWYLWYIDIFSLIHLYKQGFVLYSLDFTALQFYIPHLSNLNRFSKVNHFWLENTQTDIQPCSQNRLSLFNKDLLHLSFSIDSK